MAPRLLAVAFSLALLPLAPLLAAEPVDLLALGAGALPAVEPPSYSGWPAMHLLDDDPGSGWASVEGTIGGQRFVFALAGRATPERFELDTACIDGDGRGAKRIRLGVSDTGPGGPFATVLEAALADRRDGQRFPAAAKVAGRWVQLEILDNHGDPEWVELCSLRGFGSAPEPEPVGDVSGTYETDYSRFHLRQQGTALSGCYEYDEGAFSGSVEGRVMRIAWQESGGPEDGGPAVMVFAPDGRSFRGHFWHGTDRGRAPDGVWNGTKLSDAVGSCPHWSGSVGGEVARALAAEGRARLYGIEFDLDSAAIRPGSRAVLEDVARALAEHPDWRLAIEGHTDATGTAAHNQELSGARAAAVRDHLVARGLGAERLRATGFGASRPVADNATALGRARNRRVEIVRE
jgi:hypothetical protein